MCAILIQTMQSAHAFVRLYELDKVLPDYANTLWHIDLFHPRTGVQLLMTVKWVSTFFLCLLLQLVLCSVVSAFVLTPNFFLSRRKQPPSPTLMFALLWYAILSRIDSAGMAYE